MANEEANQGRRRFLTATTAVVGAVGVGFAAVPFIKSWKPSARAQVAGAPVEVDISKIDKSRAAPDRAMARPAGVDLQAHARR